MDRIPSAKQSPRIESDRISLECIRFEHLPNQIIYLGNVTSSGTFQVAGQSPGTDASIEKTIVDGVPVVTATVEYVSSRKFIVGKTYKALIFGKEVA